MDQETTPPVFERVCQRDIKLGVPRGRGRGRGRRTGVASCGRRGVEEREDVPLDEVYRGEHLGSVAIGLEAVRHFADSWGRTVLVSKEAKERERGRGCTRLDSVVLKFRAQAVNLSDEVVG